MRFCANGGGVHAEFDDDEELDECWLICLEHQARPSVLYNLKNELNRYLAEMAGNQRRGPKNVDELVTYAQMAWRLGAGPQYYKCLYIGGGSTAFAAGSAGMCHVANYIKWRSGKAAEHVKQVAHQNRLGERAQDAFSGVRSFDQRWRVSERTQALASSSVSTLRDIDEKHQAAFNATQRLLSGGLILAGHDRSDGGLLTAVLEMAFAGRVGVELKLDDASPGSYMEKLFNEAPGLVYEVRRSDLAAVLRVFEGEGVAVQEIGATRKDLRAVVHVGKECVLDGDVAALHCIWEATSFQLERQQCDVPCVEQEEAGFKNRRVLPYKLTYTPEPTADAVLNSGRKHRVAIVRQEGSNGDREMAAAFHMAGFEAWDVHMTDLLEGRTSLE
ncbi:unnamed protein product, partial [Cladocopium goreaui]